MRLVEPLQKLELDHLFLCTLHRMQALEALTSSGLNPGPNRVHGGQGTANDCFYFENAYLELLWLNDAAEIRSPAVQPLGLWERIHWPQTGACPYGVALRPMDGFDTATIQSWPYPAAFLPAGASIPILTPRGLTNEPMVFLSLVSMPPSDYPAERRAPLLHQGRPRRISAVRIEVPEGAASTPGLASETLSGIVEIVPGSRYDMTLTLNGGHGEVSDLRPGAPLEIHW